MKEKKDIYQLVIQEEIKAQNLYSALAKASPNEEIKGIFINLIRMEKNHEEMICELFYSEFPRIELKIDRQLTPDFSGDKNLRNPDKILKYAISKEESAAQTYLELAAQAETNEHKKIFEQFALEEKGHKNILENEILRLGGLLIWFDESELNGLMED
ncbi:MAG TPA: ferritin family protein [Candidatus Cloacimonadota bacterium]|nr:ferritin family protein [Candidatus Cloacimonadota bacterium]